MNEEKRKEKLEKIEKVIEKGGTLFYKKDEEIVGVLTNPKLTENSIFGSKELVSWWYSFEDKEEHLGKFLQPNEIEIGKKMNKLI